MIYSMFCPHLKSRPNDRPQIDIEGTLLGSVGRGSEGLGEQRTWWGVRWKVG